MTSMQVLPRGTEDWTVDDLANLPDEGLRYELVDGMLLVSPAPRLVHQRAGGRLFRLLAAACPAHLEVFYAPVDWQRRPWSARSFLRNVIAFEGYSHRSS